MYKRMIGRLLLACFMVSVMVISIGGCGKEEAEEKVVYKIGAIFATTGPAAALGIPERNTAEMLEAQITQPAASTEMK